MQQKQEFYETARAIVSFTDSYTQNKKRKEKEQSNIISESTPSITKICSSLQFLRKQIRNNNTSKQVIQIPKLLKSLSALSLYKIGIHIGQELDQMRFSIRLNSRWCLRYIQECCDEQDQSELVNKRYGRVMSISFCTAGGKGEERDYEIYNGLKYISDFLRELHEGRNGLHSYFQPLPLLARRSEEQIEEEGANEELEAQMNNNGFDGNIKRYANYVKEVTLNRFIH
ncbi:MAG: hypothetical protein EZS28_037225 [Streblomastix strix]|uniref:Uncharacterized protein n=1 Tax=Streblomastix strix TaxID=222440 RepID=A0A5J4UA26_9EUKA|nr:MAG: hypothetical protein EZS28_037225 [Streblomastix strix]